MLSRIFYMQCFIANIFCYFADAIVAIDIFFCYFQLLTILQIKANNVMQIRSLHYIIFSVIQ